MEIINEDEFKALVEKILSNKKVLISPLKKEDCKSPLLGQELFFDLHRSHHKHMPDICITEERFPCELKSPKELYDVCRYSRAHLCSYLLQTIYGQCLSYADLFRPKDNLLSIYLMIPQTVQKDIPSFSDIEAVFKDILDKECPLYMKQMELKKVEFQSPNFVDKNIGKYGKISGSCTILATKITFIHSKVI